MQEIAQLLEITSQLRNRFAESESKKFCLYIPYWA